jgi:hypothetical protein
MIVRLSRRLRARLAGDAGLGLVELLVASVIGLLLMAAVGAAYIQTIKVTNFAIQSRSSTSAAANAMQEISEVVRLATPIAVQGKSAATPAIFSATSTQLVIYSLVDTTNPASPAPSRVTLDIGSGSLVDTRCVATLVNGFWTFGTCSSTSTRTVAGTFVAPGVGQNNLFTYLDANGNVLAVSGSGVLPAGFVPLVGSIIISVNLLAPGAKNGPVYLQAKTGMPNVGIQTETS